jgi:membrane-associated phospholipid phosphatase
VTPSVPETLPRPPIEVDRRPRSGWWLALVATWCIAFVGAMFADAPVACWAHDSGTAAYVRTAWWSDWVKAPGTFWFTAALVGCGWLARRIDWRRAVFVVAVAAFAGLNVIPKWIIGRTRPYKLPIPADAQPRPFEVHPFWHGLPGLFREVNLSFPSGHECSAFALVAAAWVVWRPAAWPMLVLAVAVGVERVVENAHYASDVVGAVGFATVGSVVCKATLFSWVERRPPPGFDLGGTGS